MWTKKVRAEAHIDRKVLNDFECVEEVAGVKVKWEDNFAYYRQGSVMAGEETLVLVRLSRHGGEG